MKDAKRYAVFALLFPSAVALMLGMDVLQRLSPERMLRNLYFPFTLYGAVEKTMMAALLLLFFRVPLAAAFRRLFGGGKRPSGGSGRTSSAPPDQPDNQ
ncbi:hypothetical protein SAMN02799624_02393 [Paenibacillus sp. UNC496MF]|uniref:hypothetical protein n=1 Tax=Paenibacillus sp. UNC496MF TaxID=1502753 RepID=UPI0008F3276D|nr:hypothetical protein [Paenibacillus sp. UNC496MF]SFI86145.1 hypothetical protein SAMN02799624_02393 [Paenibacillus sp. UNC496MF]